MRNPTAGALHGATVAGGDYILQTNINAGAAVVSGIDVAANYRYPMEGWGAISTSLNGTWMQKNLQTPTRAQTATTARVCSVPIAATA